MQNLMNLFVNSCKKTTELIDKQLFTSLNTKEKIQLQVHKSMCKTCNAYENQSKFIDRVVDNWFNENTKSSVKLPEERKAKILEEINKS